MKKIMGHLTGKLSLSILSVIVLLVGLLAGMNGITSVKAGGKSLGVHGSGYEQSAGFAEQGFGGAGRD